MAQFHKHVFICTNARELEDSRGCCAARGGDAVAAAFKKRLFDMGLKRVVRPNKSGCLDQCARGVTLVVYPDGVWYGGVTVADVDEIIEQHLLGGRPVERLVIPPEALTGKPIEAWTGPPDEHPRT
jgi:(2Fe-2S) ferredoxin